MPAIARGQTSDCANPVLDLFTRLGNVLTDVAQLSYQIFDTVSGPSPVQVYPVSGRQTVDIAMACPIGDKLGTGHYVARWTVPDAEAVGTHQVTWFLKLTLASPEQSYTEEFEVLSVLVVGGGGPHEYATVQQLRDEGVTVAQASDPQLLAKIIRCSQMIERWTGRWFFPKAMTLLIDGKGADMLLLGPAIIAVTQVRILGQGSLYISSSDETVSLDQVRIYNRHLTQELLDPDDRNNPKIQWLRFENQGRRMPELAPIALFPHGVQNIQVTGTFGYTDPDGTPTGKTPDLINLACMLMVVMDLPQLANADARSEEALRGRLTSLRTRDQSISWGMTAGLRAIGSGGSWTGNPQVDSIIASYRRPPTLGAV